RTGNRRRRSCGARAIAGTAGSRSGPVHHWLAHRVKAHVFLCMLAYYVEHRIRLALAPIRFADHRPGARMRASIVRSAEPSPAAAVVEAAGIDRRIPVLGFVWKIVSAIGNP